MQTVTAEEHKALIDAANLLHDFCSKHLRDGFELVLSLRNNESSLTLIDPDYEEMDAWDTDAGISSIARACEISQQAMLFYCTCCESRPVQADGDVCEACKRG